MCLVRINYTDFAEGIVPAKQMSYACCCYSTESYNIKRILLWDSAASITLAIDCSRLQLCRPHCSRQIHNNTSVLQTIHLAGSPPPMSLKPLLTRCPNNWITTSMALSLIWLQFVDTPHVSRCDILPDTQTQSRSSIQSTAQKTQ